MATTTRMQELINQNSALQLKVNANMEERAIVNAKLNECLEQVKTLPSEMRAKVQKNTCDPIRTRLETLTHVVNDRTTTMRKNQKEIDLLLQEDIKRRGQDAEIDYTRADAQAKRDAPILLQKQNEMQAGRNKTIMTVVIIGGAVVVIGLIIWFLKK